ncbi:antichymotrypsin-2-like isoform X5 [Arctopsyche grandis]|uniref:antichymotrypsin-2-like isoform X5 n=1 Tax=Arctopsyche grandis TaxID=121162 RepID=UPI00406D70B9
MKKIYALYFIFFILVGSVVSTPFTEREAPNVINGFSLEFYKEAAIKNPEKNLIMSPLSAEVILGLLSTGARGNTQKEISEALHLPDSEIIKSTFQSTMGKETANKNTGKSLILSPLSAEVLLGLLSTGARGDTQKEISDALHLPDSEIIKSTFQTTMRKLSNIQGVVLNIANKVYVKDGEAFKLDPVFKSVAVDQFSSDVENIDFSKATRAANTINEWILALPYKNNDTYLAIILPRKVDGLAALEEKLYGANMVNIINKMRKTEVHVGIPKFKIESTIDLKHVLPELGIKLIFNKQKADLHNLLKNPEQLFVSDAKQKAFIEVNEHGTEAGVVTAFKIQIESLRNDAVFFTADHPFFYMLMNKDDIIFCGKYIGD